MAPKKRTKTKVHTARKDLKKMPNKDLSGSAQILQGLRKFWWVCAADLQTWKSAPLVRCILFCYSRSHSCATLNMETPEDVICNKPFLLSPKGNSPASPSETLIREMHLIYNEPDKTLLEVEKSSLKFPQKFIMWENNENTCWIDASLALLVHNRTVRGMIEQKPECLVSQIVKKYDEAICIINDEESGKSIEERLQIARQILHSIQESSLKYLQPLVKCKKGEPDSAFCSLLNLIKEDKLIESFLNISFAWVSKCDTCKTTKVVNAAKPIVTITYTNRFMPSNHISPSICHSCKKEQQMKLIYKKLPGCLIFHFEQGAGIDSPPLHFNIASREYQLTGIVILEKSKESNVNHFVTYIRNPSSETWLECNDLNIDIVYFTTDLPSFCLKDVYIYVYEALDSLGTIEIEEDPLLFTSNHRIPCIDLADEPNNKKVDENVENISASISASLPCSKNPLKRKHEVPSKAADTVKVCKAAKTAQGTNNSRDYLESCYKPNCDCRLWPQEKVVDCIVDYHVARMVEIFKFPLP